MSRGPAPKHPIKLPGNHVIRLHAKRSVREGGSRDTDRRQQIGSHIAFCNLNYAQRQTPSGLANGAEEFLELCRRLISLLQC
jgi:hypothetical protein